MRDMVVVDGRDGLAKHLSDQPLLPEIAPDDLKIEPYGGDDPRIGWKDVHIVTLPGFGVLGFCEGPAPSHHYPT